MALRAVFHTLQDRVDGQYSIEVETPTVSSNAQLCDWLLGHAFGSRPRDN